MKKHIGSTIALILGILLFSSGIPNASGTSNYPAGLLAGPVIILGALAYRSAKKRMLGEVVPLLLRRVLEAAAIVIILAAVLLQNDLTNRMYYDPVPNVLIPLWAIVAYAVIVLKRKKDTKEVSKQA